MQALADRYERLIDSRPGGPAVTLQVDLERAALLEIGIELFAWLDGDEAWLHTLLKSALSPLILEIRSDLRPEGAAMDVLRAPWELLALPKGVLPGREGFLAGDVTLCYAPFRCLGDPLTPSELDDYRLGVVFMASAPRGPRELDFEAEEMAILRATGPTSDLDLFGRGFG